MEKGTDQLVLIFGVSADFKRFQLIYGIFRLISGILRVSFVCLFFPRQKVVNANTYFFSMFYNYGTILAFVF